MLVGMIIPYAAPVDTTNEKDKLKALGWLLCDGSVIDRDVYSQLFNVIGTIWGNGDGGDTFNLPDMRGYFMRGVDHGSKHDPDASVRTALYEGGNSGDRVGSFQADAFAEHRHRYSVFVGDNDDWKGGGNSGGGWTGHNDDNAETSTQGGLETRPKNIYVEYLICWQSSPL